MKDKKFVDFNLLVKLSYELNSSYPIADTIGLLAMEDVPMSDAVIQLGVILGVLLPDYRGDWVEEGGN